MKIQIVEKFLERDECNTLMDYYKRYESDSIDWHGTWPLKITDSAVCTWRVREKLNEKAKDINGSEIDYVQIVKWPRGSSQPSHRDTAHDHTTLASIIYLNENIEGGETYFTDGVVIEPRIGRAVFFDGQYFEHGVNQIRHNERYSIASWYKMSE